LARAQRGLRTSRRALARPLLTLDGIGRLQQRPRDSARVAAGRALAGLKLDRTWRRAGGDEDGIEGILDDLHGL